MYKVKLHSLVYYAKIGLFPQERVLTNRFEVSLWVGLEKELQLQNQLADLIDYSWLKDIVDVEMQKEYQFLEDILAQIKSNILKKYPKAIGEISIKKCPPPFGGNVESAEVIIDF